MTELLHQWVDRQAERRPEDIAIVLDHQHLTYGALEMLSNQLAHTLKEAGCRRGDRVCVLMPKTPLAVVAALGIYKADCVYVPLDTSGPAARLAKMLSSSESCAILAAGAGGRTLEQLMVHRWLPKKPVIGWLDATPVHSIEGVETFSLEDMCRHSWDRPGYKNRRDDIAHIVFTSGSTGEPKGVSISHSNVIHFIEWATRYFQITDSDRLSAHSPLHFDLSFFDIFSAFAPGAQLHLVPPRATLMPERLIEWIRRSGITQWCSVPSVMNHMAKLDLVRHKDFPRLKRLVWCGEVFPTKSLIYWMARLPHVSFTNLYGPTETTIASSYYTVPHCPPDSRAEIPIGTACDGEWLRVLDEAGRPVPDGRAGELYIGGAGLSPGYWKDEARTREAFVQDPLGAGERIYKTGDLVRIGEDGLVHFLGRSDSQIKRRGYRIELGEIESALNAMDFLRECAVVALPSDEFDEAVISCAYVGSSGTDITPVRLRGELEKAVPRYMIPSRWVALEELPRSTTGKVDRRCLREMLRDETVVSPPRVNRDRTERFGPAVPLGDDGRPRRRRDSLNGEPWR